MYDVFDDIFNVDDDLALEGYTDTDDFALESLFEDDEEDMTEIDNALALEAFLSMDDGVEVDYALEADSALKKAGNWIKTKFKDAVTKIKEFFKKLGHSIALWGSSLKLKIEASNKKNYDSSLSQLLDKLDEQVEKASDKGAARKKVNQVKKAVYAAIQNSRNNIAIMNKQIAILESGVKAFDATGKKIMVELAKVIKSGKAEVTQINVNGLLGDLTKIDEKMEKANKTYKEAEEKIGKLDGFDTLTKAGTKSINNGAKSKSLGGNFAAIVLSVVRKDIKMDGLMRAGNILQGTCQDTENALDKFDHYLATGNDLDPKDKKYNTPVKVEDSDGKKKDWDGAAVSQKWQLSMQLLREFAAKARAISSNLTKTAFGSTVGTTGVAYAT